MLISDDIDQDLRSTISYLDSRGFKPFSSCDGVIKHHQDDLEDVMASFAYISFLDSPNIESLLMAFLREHFFNVSIANANYFNPYDLYGNTISGNTYGIYYTNLLGEQSKRVNNILHNLPRDSYKRTKKDAHVIRSIINLFRKSKNSVFSMEVDIIGKEFIPYRLENLINSSISILVQNKLDSTITKDINYIAHMIAHKFKIPYSDYLYYTDEESMVFVCGDFCLIRLPYHSIQKVFFILRYVFKMENTIPNKIYTDYDYEIFDADAEDDSGYYFDDYDDAFAVTTDEDQA